MCTVGGTGSAWPVYCWWVVAGPALVPVVRKRLAHLHAPLVRAVDLEVVAVGGVQTQQPVAAATERCGTGLKSWPRTRIRSRANRAWRCPYHLHTNVRRKLGYALCRRARPQTATLHDTVRITRPRPPTWGT